MRFFTTIAGLLTLSLVGTALAAPAPPALKSVEKFEGQANGKYIIKLKSGVSRKGWVSKLKNQKTAVDWALINGIGAHLDDDELETLRASPDVESIAEDGIMSIFATATQTNAPWGLQRISQAGALSNTNTAALTFTYTYDTTAGAGVDIYIVDTGVLTTHTEFGGRAKWGTSFVGTTTDGHGHGTHCAGTAAGSTYGVAKKANIIAVQVLDSSGSGATSGIISGLNWVLTQAKASGRPSVVSMSLGGSASSSLDSAVASLTAGGVHVVVAAGNSNVDAANTSPARAPSAITVAATTIADAKASYSNYGSIIDVWAPGTNIISSWIGSSNTATNSISGTSMATPHVAGVVAYLLGKDGSITPAAMETKIKSLSSKNVLSGVPSGTVNQVVHI
ncbi:serine protease [Ephemerocybe angulata]|uniref:Serine protease n=1 Tax=Ephemerocybe angulata TaxID=980116 RepID=A0A8H6LYZ8_9AGAR|nr:serine protease [Tulosesus angulatus]